MRRNDPWSCYRQVATTTASPGQLVLMLFDGAINFLERALRGFSLDDPAESNQAIGNNILRAQAILDELDRSLDMSGGGEFSENMRRLYIYLDRRLTESNLQKEPAGIQEVVQRLSVLREAWNQMLQQQGASIPQSSPALAGAV